MTECHESTFLMTPRQHRQWAKNARKRHRPDLAQAHEQLARAIEIVERRWRFACMAACGETKLIGV